MVPAAGQEQGFVLSVQTGVGGEGCPCDFVRLLRILALESNLAVLYFKNTKDTTMSKFSLGQIVATPAALKAIEEAGQSPAFFLDRHSQGDWGEVDDGDKALNDAALVDGSRLLSAYRTLKGERIWIITEAEDDDGKRAATTILLPEQY